MEKAQSTLLAIRSIDVVFRVHVDAEDNNLHQRPVHVHPQVDVGIAAPTFLPVYMVLILSGRTQSV
jgi:hypothetical protein